MKEDTSLLQAALIGYESEISRLHAEIAAIQKELGTAKRSVLGGGAGSPAPHTMSDAGRKRIAAAQRKRWAAYKAKKK